MHFFCGLSRTPSKLLDGIIYTFNLPGPGLDSSPANQRDQTRGVYEISFSPFSDWQSAMAERNPPPVNVPVQDSARPLRGFSIHLLRIWTLTALCEAGTHYQRMAYPMKGSE
jgi:hypothetical protein